MRQWTSQQKAEKMARKTEEKEDEMRFHQYLMAVDNMRGTMETEEKERVRQEMINCRKFNEEQAELTAQTRAAQADLQAKMNEVRA